MTNKTQDLAIVQIYLPKSPLDWHGEDYVLVEAIVAGIRKDEEEP